MSCGLTGCFHNEDYALALLQQVSVSYKGNIRFEHTTHPLDVFGLLAEVEFAAQRRG